MLLETDETLDVPHSVVSVGDISECGSGGMAQEARNIRYIVRMRKMDKVIQAPPCQLKNYASLDFS